MRDVAERTLAVDGPSFQCAIEFAADGAGPPDNVRILDEELDKGGDAGEDGYALKRDVSASGPITPPSPGPTGASGGFHGFSPGSYEEFS